MLNADSHSPSTFAENIQFKPNLHQVTPLKNEKAGICVSPSDIRGYPQRTQVASGKNKKRKIKTMISTNILEKTQNENNNMKKQI